MKITSADMPAMPTFVTTTASGDTYEGWHGLTKREYFAGMVMPALCAELGEYASPEHIAHDAVIYADALLAALEREQSA